jgi:predicted nucleic-acid-binding Zn-ribbon protein
MGSMDDPREARRNQERTKLQEWLDKKWTEKAKCPICGTDDWALGEIVGALPEATSRFVAGPQYPLAAVFCNTCGYARFFNALVAQVVERDTPPAEEGSAEEKPS